MRNANTSLMGSPILIGAATTLMTVVAVFLSYNANNGLPFVPTYDVSVRVPSAAGLVRGNEARIGGKRVGIVKAINAEQSEDGPVARLDLKLDRTAGPLHAATRVTVRPRSPLGIKYLEIVPSDKGRALAANEVLPLSQSRVTVDLDQVLAAFDEPTRRWTQLGVAGLGTGLAGRGVDFNVLLADAPALLNDAESVAGNFADPRTDLAGFVRGLSGAAAEAAPVAPQLGRLMANASTTLGALAGVAPELQAVLGGLPPVEAEGTEMLAVARPVLRDARVLVGDLRPGIEQLTPAATRLHSAIDTGIPVVRRAIDLSDRLEATLAAVEELSSDPQTRDALERLRTTLDSALPTTRFLVPAQTVCNYLGLWTRNANSTISEGDTSGTWFRTLVIAATDEFLASDRPADSLHVTPYGYHAAPGQPRECEVGNEGYAPGQVIGHPPGAQPARTEDTAPPEDVGAP
jgi:ABC-type transporter Mla subunit MlaD